MVSKYGQPAGFTYPASKFAVNGMTLSWARELGPKGIRVNAVAPGITETDMMKAVPREVIEPMIQRIPLRRLGQPEEIAKAAKAAKPTRGAPLPPTARTICSASWREIKRPAAWGSG